MTKARTDSDKLTTTTVQQHTPACTSSSYHTEPGVLCAPHDLEAIRQGYEQVLGLLNVFKARDIEAALRSGLDAGAILDAIEETAMAPRPSHYYLRAILR